jgi:pimeloyl-ACP methyl ester carboxylesterase
MAVQVAPLVVAPPSFVEVNGHRIAYDEVAPPNPKGTVLLLTGLASKRLGWRMQMQPFGQVYRTIAMDHRDSGDSFYAEAPYMTADQAEDVAGLMRALGVTRAHVVGISMGGFIALELALRHPELVDRLVLTSTSAGGPTHVPAGFWMRLALRLPRSRRGDIGKLAKRSYRAIMAPGYARTHPEVIEIIAEIARYRPQTPAGYGRQLHTCLTHNASSRLDAIHAPTLVIHGTQDPLVPVGNGRYLASHIPGARLILYERTGHVPIVERPEDYNRDVLAFLGEGSTV